MHKVEIERLSEIEKSICKTPEGFSVVKTEFTAFALRKLLFVCYQSTLTASIMPSLGLKELNNTVKKKSTKQCKLSCPRNADSTGNAN